MYPLPHYKTKIVAGKLVSVPVYPEHEQHGRYRSEEYLQTKERYGASSDIHISINASAKHEAEQNKQRALAQTYRSVLSPEPTHRTSYTRPTQSDVLSTQLLHEISHNSRSTLLTAMSSLRRLDPQENGVLSYIEIQEVLSLYNVSMRQDVLNKLFDKFQVVGADIDYKGLWKYVMDCYSMKDQLHGDSANKESQRLNDYYAQRLSHRTNLPCETVNSFTLTPGLKSELEFELRQYARMNQSCIDTSTIARLCMMRDQYRTGKILGTQMLDICYEGMDGINMNIIHRVLKTCDTESNGLVDYPKFLQVLTKAQPTYLPPITRSLSPVTDHSSTGVWYPDKSRYNTVEASSTSNHKQLEELGRLELHLSDFETKVVSRKSPVSSPDLLPVQEERARRDITNGNKTYTLSSPELSKKVPVVRITSTTQTTCNTHGSSHRSPSRKKWHVNTAHITTGVAPSSLMSVSPRLSSKVEKWWKQDLSSSLNNTKAGRSGWSQSKPIKSIKAKKRRKKKMLKTESGKAIHKGEASNESEHFLTTTDVDSECYTTTDVEVVVCDKKKHYTFESEEEENEVGENKRNCNESSRVPQTEVCCQQANQSLSPEANSEIAKGLPFELDEKLRVESLSPQIKNTSEKCEQIKIGDKDYTFYPCVEDANTVFAMEAPKEKLQLDWIYGFGGNPIHAVRNGDIVSFIGSIGVVMDIDKQKQRFYRKHSHSITCLCIHKDNVTIATAEPKENDTRKCAVYIWNVIDLSTISSVFIDSSDADIIVAMDFQKVMDKLILGMIETSKHRTQIQIYECRSSTAMHTILLSNASLTSAKHAGLIFSNHHENMFVSFDRHSHLNFFEITADLNLEKHPAHFGGLEPSKCITTATFNLNGVLITGNHNGTIYVWDGHKIDHAIKNAHESSISSMVCTSDGFLITACCKDNSLRVWNQQMKCQTDSFKLRRGDMIGIHSLCVFEKTLYICTTANHLYTTSLQADNLLCNAHESLTCVLEGQSDIVTSMCCHPSYNEMMLLLSADGLVTMYNVHSHTSVWTTQVKGNGSFICVHPKEELVFVGCQDGSLHTLSSTTGVLLDRLKSHNACITLMQPSPDGSCVICGMVDGALLVYQFDFNSHELELSSSNYKMCQQSIQAIDWCDPHYVIRVQCADTSVRYYDVKNEIVVENNIELKWSTSSCFMAYELVGALKSDRHTKPVVFNVCKTKRIIALACKRMLQLVRYPWLHEKAEMNSTPLCGRYENSAKQVCFSHDSAFLFVSVNHDNAFMQWKVIN